VSDGNGCIATASIELVAPPALTAVFEINELACFESNSGSVTITPAGGVPAYQYAIEGQSYQDAPTLTGLTDGIHVCVAKDANDCEVNGIVRIDVPLAVDVELGEDRFIQNGEETSLYALINIPQDSITGLRWYTQAGDLCDGCTDLDVAPLLTTTYYAEAISVDGCVGIDSVTVHVIQDTEVYIPNVFTPNGDGINDRLVIMTKSNVTRISRMQIFDRWGNAVFEKTNLLTNDPAIGWDGAWNDKPLNPGVFVYRILVDFIDGSQVLFQGDITILR
jgi:gliding motility-associated-like protein